MKQAAQVLVGLCLLVLGTQMAAAAPTAKAPIYANGKEIFAIEAGVGSLSPAERAEIVNRRIHDLVSTPGKTPTITVYSSDVGWLILGNGRPIISVTEGDAKAEGVTPEVLAHRWASAIEQETGEEHRTEELHALWMRLILTAIVVAGALFLMLFLVWSFRKLRGALEARREKVPHIQLRGYELVSQEKVHRTADLAIRATRVVLMILVLVVATLLIFGQFPATRNVALKILDWTLQPLADIGRGLLHTLPNLFYIAVILIVTRVVLRAVSFLFAQVERGVITLEPWIHRDVARPTGQIVKMIAVIVALFFIAPLIPGTGSTAAKGISIILGLMVSFGSTSAVGNAIAGVVLTYMRPFQPGDRVQVGQITGDVMERTFLYTKVRTVKNEEVIVPSLQALGLPITNFSAGAHASGLILHTSVTISYDAPWRKVHELLIQAALRTANILKEPKPFVLQMSLNDFFVSYELNAYTARAGEMQNIYSELHQNIQDAFNEGGIEILSPHYQQLRDGNATSIPASYPPAEKRPRRFAVEVHSASPAS